MATIQYLTGPNGAPLAVLPAEHAGGSVQANGATALQLQGVGLQKLVALPQFAAAPQARLAPPTANAGATTAVFQQAGQRFVPFHPAGTAAQPHHGSAVRIGGTTYQVSTNPGGLQLQAATARPPAAPATTVQQLPSGTQFINAYNAEGQPITIAINNGNATLLPTRAAPTPPTPAMAGQQQLFTAVAQPGQASSPTVFTLQNGQQVQLRQLGHSIASNGAATFITPQGTRLVQVTNADLHHALQQAQQQQQMAAAAGAPAGVYKIIQTTGNASSSLPGGEQRILLHTAAGQNGVPITLQTTRLVSGNSTPANSMPHGGLKPLQPLASTGIPAALQVSLGSAVVPAGSATGIQMGHSLIHMPLQHSPGGVAGPSAAAVTAGNPAGVTLLGGGAPVVGNGVGKPMPTLQQLMVGPPGLAAGNKPHAVQQQQLVQVQLPNGQTTYIIKPQTQQQPAGARPTDFTNMATSAAAGPALESVAAAAAGLVGAGSVVTPSAGGAVVQQQVQDTAAQQRQQQLLASLRARVAALHQQQPLPADGGASAVPTHLADQLLQRHQQQQQHMMMMRAAAAINSGNAALAQQMAALGGLHASAGLSPMLLDLNLTGGNLLQAAGGSGQVVALGGGGPSGGSALDLDAAGARRGASMGAVEPTGAGQGLVDAAKGSGEEAVATMMPSGGMAPATHSSHGSVASAASLHLPSAHPNKTGSHNADGASGKSGAVASGMPPPGTASAAAPGAAVSDDLRGILLSIGMELARHGISVETAVEAGWLGMLGPADVAVLHEAFRAEEQRLALDAVAAASAHHQHHQHQVHLLGGGGSAGAGVGAGRALFGQPQPPQLHLQQPSSAVSSPRPAALQLSAAGPPRFGSQGSPAASMVPGLGQAAGGGLLVFDGGVLSGLGPAAALPNSAYEGARHGGSVGAASDGAAHALGLDGSSHEVIDDAMFSAYAYDFFAVMEGMAAGAGGAPAAPGLLEPLEPAGDKASAPPSQGSSVLGSCASPAPTPLGGKPEPSSLLFGGQLLADASGLLAGAGGALTVRDAPARAPSWPPRQPLGGLVELGVVAGQNSMTAISDLGSNVYNQVQRLVSAPPAVAPAAAAGQDKASATDLSAGNSHNQELVARFATLDLGCGFF